MMRALDQAAGNVLGAATILGVHRSSLQRRINKSEKLQKHLAEARERQVDIAEIKLNAALGRNERWAVKYVLSTQGKHRGYTTKVEHDVTGQIDLDITGVDFSEPDD